MPQNDLLTMWQFGNSRHDFRRRQLCRKRSHRAVHHHVAQVPQQLLCTVLRRLELEQLWIFIDEISVKIPREKLVVPQDIHEKRDVRLLTAHACMHIARTTAPAVAPLGQLIIYHHG